MTLEADVGHADPNAHLIDSGRAWVAAVGVALANGLGFGIAYTFGTFFDSMAEEFGADRGSTALMFGITLLFFFGCGVVTGPLFDRVGPRPLLAVGGTIFVLGLLATSRAPNLWAGIASYSIGVGIGGGIYVAPLTASIGRMFVRLRPAALGLVAVGNGLGVLILIPLTEQVISTNGWRRAFVVLAGIVAVGLAVAYLTTVRPPRQIVPQIQPTARSIVARPGFMALFVAAVFASIALFIAFGFIQTFAIDDGVAVDTAARLMSLVGLTSIIGRLGQVRLVNTLGAVGVLRTALVVQAAVYVIWLRAGGSVGWLTVFVLLFGAAYGAFVSVTPEALIRLVGMEGIGKSMGLMFSSFGIGGLIGPPLAGWLADSTTGHSVPISITIGLVIASFGVLTFAPNPKS